MRQGRKAILEPRRALRSLREYKGGEWGDSSNREGLFIEGLFPSGEHLQSPQRRTDPETVPLLSEEIYLSFLAFCIDKVSICMVNSPQDK